MGEEWDTHTTNTMKCVLSESGDMAEWLGAVFMQKMRTMHEVLGYCTPFADKPFSCYLLLPFLRA